MKKNILIMIVATAVAVVVFFAYRYFSEKDSNVLKFSGELEMRRVDVSFRVSGEVSKLYFDEGASVTKQALLAEIDPIEYQSQVNLFKADLDAAEWAFNEANAGATKEDREQAKSQLAQAKADEARALKEYKRVKTLYEAKSISEADFDKVSNAYEVASHRVNQLSELVKQIDVVGTRKEKKEQARARYEAAKANYALAQQRLAFTKLYSPLEGVILNKYREVGEFAQAGLPIFSIGNPKELWLRAYLPETQAHMIKVGDKMAVSVDSLPDRKFQGVVSFISDSAEFTPKQIQTSVERVKLVYRIKIDLKDDDGILKPGIPADAVLWK